MKNILEEKITNLFIGYDVEYIEEALEHSLREVKRCTASYVMKPCPRCGDKNAYVSCTYKSGAESNPHAISSMYGICRHCGLQSRHVTIDDITRYGKVGTPAMMRLEAIKTWNSMRFIPVDNFFKICEDAFGKDYQDACLSEETCELIVALMKMGMLTSRVKRPDRAVVIDDIVSEMADVIICTYQWLYSHDVDFSNLDIAIKSKIDRTCQHDVVRTAIVKLSRKITEATDINAPSVDDTSHQNKL